MAGLLSSEGGPPPSWAAPCRLRNPASATRRECGRAAYSGRVNRALVSLICGALLVLLIGVGQEPRAAVAAVLGVVFAATAVAFQLYPRRGKWLVVGYFLIQLPLGYVVFGAAGG